MSILNAPHARSASPAVAATFLSLLTLPAFGATVDTSSLRNGDTYDQFIVKYRPGSLQDAEVTNSLRSATGSLKSTHSDIDIRRLRRTALGAEVLRTTRALGASEAETLLRAIATDPRVEYVEVDAPMYPTMTPNDPRFGEQWGYTGLVAGIRAPQAWDRATGAGVVVAVLDTGITPHSDLNANVLPGYDFISDAARARDGNGRDPNPADEGDWRSANECGAGVSAANSSWHGTHVAGTIAAVTNNAKGVAGTAFESKIVPVRVLGRCGGTVSDIADAIVWASGGSVPGVPSNANPAEVINLSLGGAGTCSATYQSAINGAVSRGSTIVVSAGNSNADAASFQPASCANVITVGAVDRNGTRSIWGGGQASNYGSRVDLSAPGSDILSTLNAGATTPASESYAYYGGTSMAAPHVSGVLALMQSVARTPLTPSQAGTVLKNTATPFPTTPSQSIGTGIVNARAAVEAVAPARPDIYAINKQGGSATEVHVLDGGDGFQSFPLQTATALHVTGADARWVFLLGDFNADGVTDLYAINKQGASSTEVHVLDGASHFQTFLMQTATALHQTGNDSSWTFALGDYDRDGALDLYAIQKQGGGSSRTEVHVLNGATGFQSFLLHTATALHPTGSDSTWMFDLADYDRDGALDLYAVNRQGASSTEVHVLDGATGFQSFKMQTATALHMTGHDPSWSFALQDQNADGAPDLYAVRKQGGASGRTEVFILNGAGHFQTFLLQTATALHQTGSDHAWQMLVAPGH